MKKRTTLAATLILFLVSLISACGSNSNQQTNATNTATPIPTPTPTPTPNQAAVEAIRLLRRMSSATEMGITFRDYSSRMIDLNADVQELLAQLPEGELKNEIRLSLEAFVDANAISSDTHNKISNITIRLLIQQG